MLTEHDRDILVQAFRIAQEFGVPVQYLAYYCHGAAKTEYIAEALALDGDEEMVSRGELVALL
jgi:hypothetical protein